MVRLGRLWEGTRLEWVYTTFDSFWVSYVITLIMTAIIFKVAFARRLPVLKTVIIYIVLAAGCYLFTIMHILRFPVIPALAITLVVIVIARVRMAISGRERRE